MPVRIQRKRTKGYRLPDNTASVTRPGKWGNPFKVGVPVQDPREGGGMVTPETVNQCLELYRIYLENKLSDTSSALAKSIDELRGKNLACFCKLEDSCHGDILLEMVNK